MVAAAVMAISLTASVDALLTEQPDRGHTTLVMFAVHVDTSGRVMSCKPIEVIDPETRKAQSASILSGAFTENACRDLSKREWPAAPADSAGGISGLFGSCFVVSSQPNTPQYCVSNLGANAD